MKFKKKLSVIDSSNKFHSFRNLNSSVPLQHVLFILTGPVRPIQFPLPLFRLLYGYFHVEQFLYRIFPFRLLTNWFLNPFRPLSHWCVSPVDANGSEVEMGLKTFSQFQLLTHWCLNPFRLLVHCVWSRLILCHYL